MLPIQIVERELRKVAGTIIVMLDCCASGGAIGISEESALFAAQLNDAFAASLFPASKYLVTCSTTLNRDSYRIMQADGDFNGKISFSELFDFVSRRVELYLANGRNDFGNEFIQTVCSNAPNDPLIIFSR